MGGTSGLVRSRPRSASGRLGRAMRRPLPRVTSAGGSGATGTSSPATSSTLFPWMTGRDSGMSDLRPLRPALLCLSQNEQDGWSASHSLARAPIRMRPPARQSYTASTLTKMAPEPASGELSWVRQHAALASTETGS